MTAIAYSGVYFGQIIASLAGGVMMQTWGLSSPFFLFGGLAVLWVLAWMRLGHSSPGTLYLSNLLACQDTFARGNCTSSGRHSPAHTASPSER